MGENGISHTESSHHNCKTYYLCTSEANMRKYNAMQRKRITKTVTKENIQERWLRVISTLFYDTNAILMLQDRVLENPFWLSSKTLEELEHIKVSGNRTEEIRYKARKNSTYLR